MRETDAIRLRHMLDAARDAMAFAASKGSQDLATDRMFALAVVKSIEIIGEAATAVSTAGRSAYPSIPWRQIIGTRNRLIHSYFEIDYDIVWDTVTRDLPPLVAQLQQILADEDAPQRASHESE
jgi:uncharacterized protein with HEPN domain